MQSGETIGGARYRVRSGEKEAGIVTDLLRACSLRRQSRRHVTELEVEKKRPELLLIL